MNWYYVDGGRKTGPVTDSDIDRLAAEGKISSSTLVWNELTSAWKPYGEVRKTDEELPDDIGENKTAHGSSSAASSGESPRSALCSQCGRSFPEDELIQYGDSRICASCKPLFFQRLKEGGRGPGAIEYAGFWIRFAAKFIDGILLAFLNMIISFLGVFASAGGGEGSLIQMGVVSFLQMSLAAAYATFFVGKYGATPGKMACNIKIITADQEPVSYARAVGRHFAEFLSSIILGIGYIMAAFDEEKRTLHDRICGTRVVKR